MGAEYLESGKVVNTHGVKGEIKILPWCDSPEFLLQFKRIRIDNKDYEIQKSHVHGNCILIKLAGIDAINDAMVLCNKVVYIYRKDVALPDNKYFIADLVGLSVYEEGRCLGILSEVIQLPSNDVYVVKGTKQFMIPVVDDYVKSIDIENGIVNVVTIEGMQIDD